MIGFLMATKPGRSVAPWLHRVLHPENRHPWRFQQTGGCVLCRAVFRDLARRIPYLDADFPDQSTVRLSEPEYDADGKLTRAGVEMPASMKRKFDALEPEAAAELMEHINRIARDP